MEIWPLSQKVIIRIYFGSLSVKATFKAHGHMEDEYKSQGTEKDSITNDIRNEFAPILSSNEEEAQNSTYLQAQIQETIPIIVQNFNILLNDSNLENQASMILLLHQINRNLRFYINTNNDKKIQIIEFPYEELSLLFNLLDSTESKTLIFSCLYEAAKIDLNFHLTSISEANLQVYIGLISSINPEVLYFEYFIKFVLEMINSDLSASELFVPGLFQLFDRCLLFQLSTDSYKDLLYIFNLIIQCSDESNSENLLLFCHRFITSIDKNPELINLCFQCFSSFIQRFNLDLIHSDLSQLLIEKGMNCPTSSDVLNCLLLFPKDSLIIPDIYFDSILKVISNPLGENQFECLDFMIHYQNSCNKLVNDEYLFDILLWGANSKEFAVSFKFTECSFYYHVPANFSIDFGIFKLCLSYLETNLFLDCVRKIRQIIDFYITSNQEQLGQFLDLLDQDFLKSIEDLAMNKEITSDEYLEIMSDLEFFNELF